MNAGVDGGGVNPDMRLPAEPSTAGDVLRQTICLPARLALDGKVFGSPIRQLDHLDRVEEAAVVAYEKRGQVRGQLARCDDGQSILFLKERYPPPAAVDTVLLLPKEGQEATGQPLVLGQGAQWLKPKPNSLNIATRDEWVARAEAVRASWAGSFAFRQEQRDNGEVVSRGLRSPQLGALYAALAHWTVTSEPGTVVMPTGTGKTETMLALLAHQQLERL